MAAQEDDREGLDTLKTAPAASGRDSPKLPPMLVRLVCAEDLRPPSERHWLEGVDEVRILRGRPAAVRREGKTLTLTLEDAYASGRHALLRRADGGFLVSDEGSTNGTLVDGRPLAEGEQRLVRSGLLEVGHTFFHLRTEVHGAREAPAAEDGGEPLTLNPEFSLGLASAGRLVRRAHDLLITGPSGAGKEVVARWLHALSGRTGPLVAVNCAAVPEHLLEDELFGHVKGAFSGAMSDRPGLLRAAHQGTLLLDEIGDMPAPLQAKLLRVIEDRRVRPVGSEHEVQVDLLVIAATHRDLRTLVAEGRFREDLLARLGLLPLDIPALSDRREDLGLLLRRMLRDVPGGLERVRFELDALRMLLMHDWPLNVRELRRAVLASVDLAHADDAEPIVVGPRHLPLAVFPRPSSAPGPALTPADAELRERLVTLLAEHSGNVAAVARAMGKPRTQVQRLMARLGLQRTGV
ncbi:MAG: sigma 54-interacting transcriptional regulator [Myxococcaceae bacterium]